MPPATAAARAAQPQPDPTPTWVSRRRLCRESGLSPWRAATLAVAGRIRTTTRIGVLPKYCLEDAMEVASEER